MATVGKCNFHKKLAKKTLPRYNLTKHKEDKVLKGRLFRLKISQVVLVCTVGALVWLIYGFSTASAETALVSLNVASGVLEMSLSASKVSVSLAPVNNTAAFNTGDIIVTVGTNNPLGYNLTMSAENYEPKIPRNAALSDNSIPTIDPIPYVSGGYTESTFRSSSDTTNKWGYKILGNYYPLLASDVYLHSSDTNNNGESTTITFAAKVDSTQPAGTYSTEITFAAVAIPKPMYIMQDVDTWENMIAVGETVEAMDNRTGYIYEVTKLTDNGVNYLWMKNNLKLPAGTVLSSSDSNVSSNFTLPTEEWTSSSQNYYCKAIMAVAGGEYYYNWYAAKANPYVCTNPTASTNATSTNDNRSLGSICPKGWILPTYNDITYNTLWNGGANPGGISSTGYFDAGAVDGVGVLWTAWSQTRNNNPSAYEIDSYHAGRGTTDKTQGYPVRCVHQQSAKKIVFKAGEGIDTIIVVDESDDYKPYYATPGEPAVIPHNGANHEYVVTVVPRQGYILDNWSSESSNYSGSLSSQTSLVTIFNSGSNGNTLTATGVAGHYEYMQSNPTCSSSIKNLTDSRDGKSYAVSAIYGYCYMLSNLRLGPGITLTSSDSNITPNNYYSYFTTPTEEWTSSSQDYQCKAIMAVAGGEYYYNWYAAKANPYACANPTTSTNFTSVNNNKSLGSICPKGWFMPTYNELQPTYLWDDGVNAGVLYFSGAFYSGSQIDVGDPYEGADWWTSDSTAKALTLYKNSGSNLFTIGITTTSNASYGRSVRCVKDNNY